MKITNHMVYTQAGSIPLSPSPWKIIVTWYSTIACLPSRYLAIRLICHTFIQGTHNYIMLVVSTC